MSGTAYLRQAGAAILAGRRDKTLAELQTMRPREDYEYMEVLRQQRQPGRKRVQAWEDCRRVLEGHIAEQMDIRLSHDQTRLMDEIRNSLLIKMYGNVQAVIADMAWLRANLGIESAYDAVAIIFPRRSGKSLTQTAASAITSASQPGGNVLGFNPNQEQAKTWLALCVRFLYMLKGDARFGWVLVAHRESKEIIITVLLYKTTSSVYVYGNGTNGKNAQNLRGTGNSAMLVNFDEGFFFCDEAYEVILPVIANGAAFVITSSVPLQETSSFNLTKALNENGRPVMRIHNWSNSCDDCAEKERRLKREITCHHMAQKPSNFRSKVDEKRLQALMRPFGAAAYAREMRNQAAVANSLPVFDHALIDRCLGREAPVVARTGELTHFFVGLDPGSTSRRSDTAMVAFSCGNSLHGYPLMENLMTPLSGYVTVRVSPSSSPSSASHSMASLASERGEGTESATGRGRGGGRKDDSATP